MVDHSDIVGASPVGAAPTTSSFRLDTWLQWIGQRQLQDETRIIQVLGFGEAYIRDFMVLMMSICKLSLEITCLKLHMNLREANELNFNDSLGKLGVTFLSDLGHGYLGFIFSSEFGSRSNLIIQFVIRLVYSRKLTNSQSNLIADMMLF